VSISTSLYSILKNDPGVQSIFGSPPRIFPETIPEGVNTPAAIYFIVSGQLAGGMEAARAADNEHIQIDVYSTDDRDLAWSGMDAIRTALENENALMSVQLGARCLGANATDYDQPTHRYRVSYDWSFWQSQ
jgi:hypothetical protein